MRSTLKRIKDTPLASKEAVWLIVFLLFVLAAIVGLIVYKQTSNYYLSKLSVIENKSEMNLSMVEKELGEIDYFLSRVNSVLEDKGLEEFSSDYQSAPLLNEEPATMLAFYKNYLKKFEEKLDGTPFGTPHPGRITSEFGGRANPFSRSGHESHSGMDFKGQIGDPVLATATGTVIFAGARGGYGNCVILEHRNGVQTLYAHLNKISVREHQRIKTGMPIGELGNTGRSTGPHVHYEVIENEEKVNPRKYMAYK